MKNFKYNNNSIGLIIFTIILCVFGFIMVFSSSYYISINKSGTPFMFFKKEIKWLLFSVILCIISSKIPYKIYYKLAWIIFIITVFLLLFVFVSSRGTDVARWIYLSPLGFSIMPGEFTKFGIIIFVSYAIAKKPNIMSKSFVDLLPIMFAVFGCFVLILKQPNLSTALTVVVIAYGVMVVAGLKKRYIIISIILSFIGVMAIILGNKDSYKYNRFLSFLDPWAVSGKEGYQVCQSLKGLGSGGLTGVGLGDSIQKINYLPEAHTDFILSIIGEELGFLGILLLLMLYMFLIYFSIRIAIASVDLFGMLLVSGIITMIGIQVVFNFAVVSSSMPPTGVALPFISFGGNSLMISMWCVGIMLNISSKSFKKRKKELREKIL